MPLLVAGVTQVSLLHVLPINCLLHVTALNASHQQQLMLVFVLTQLTFCHQQASQCLMLWATTVPVCRQTAKRML